MVKLFMDNNLLNTKLWFQKADNDIKAIKELIDSEEPLTDIICFHAQQAIEKYIKGALIYFGERVSKTHDLVNLLTSIKKYIPELEYMENELDNISRFGVESRYPDMSYEPTKSEAKQSYEIALKVKEIVLNKIK